MSLREADQINLSAFKCLLSHVSHVTIHKRPIKAIIPKKHWAALILSGQHHQNDLGNLGALAFGTSRCSIMQNLERFFPHSLLDITSSSMTVWCATKQNSTGVFFKHSVSFLSLLKQNFKTIPWALFCVPCWWQNIFLLYIFVQKPAYCFHGLSIVFSFRPLLSPLTFPLRANIQDDESQAGLVTFDPCLLCVCQSRVSFQSLLRSALTWNVHVFPASCLVHRTVAYLVAHPFF